MLQNPEILQVVSRRHLQQCAQWFQVTVLMGLNLWLLESESCLVEVLGDLTPSCLLEREPHSDLRAYRCAVGTTAAKPWVKLGCRA